MVSRTPEELPTPELPLSPEGEPGAIPSVSETTPVEPLQAEESRPALLGLRRFVTATRLAMAKETHSGRQATNKVVRAIPREARVIRGFRTTSKKDTPGIDPETDTRSDAEKRRDEIFESHNRGPENPSADSIPVTLPERLVSLHRQGQVHKLRQIDRERAAHTEVHGRKASAEDLSEEAQQEISGRHDVIMSMSRPAAAARWDKAVTKQKTGDMGKVIDHSPEAYIEHVYGPAPEGAAGPRVRGYQRRAVKGAFKAEGKLDKKAERLESRLGRGAAGDTLPGHIRDVLTERSGNNVDRLQRRLAELNRLAGIEPDAIEAILLDEAEAEPAPVSLSSPEGPKTEDDEIRDLLFHEPMIDQEAIDALSDEDREELAEDDRAIKLAGLFAPTDTFSKLTDEERKLVYLTAEMRLRKFISVINERRPEGFSSFDAGWEQADGSIKPVHVIGLAKPNEAMGDTTYVHIEGTKLAVPLKHMVIPKELRKEVEDIAEKLRPASVKAKRRKGGRRSEAPVKEDEIVYTLADVDPKYHGLYDLVRIKQLDQDIADEIIRQKDDALRGTGRSMMPPDEFYALGDKVRADETETHLQKVAEELALDDYSDKAVALFEQLLNEARYEREGKEAAARAARAAARGPRKPRR